MKSASDIDAHAFYKIGFYEEKLGHHKPRHQDTKHMVKNYLVRVDRFTPSATELGAAAS